MSWHKVNNFELQACRKLLMLEVREAADLIGKVSVRTWQYWESGRNKVPSDVESEIYSLISIRNEKITALTKWQFDNPDDTLKLNYYHTYEDYQKDNKGNKIDWRIHQAAVSFIFSEGGEVELN